MRLYTSALLSILFLNKIDCYAQRKDSLAFYKNKWDSVRTVQGKIDSLSSIHEYSFKYFRLDPFLKLGTGFVATDPKNNQGLLTVNFEAGLQPRILFRKKTFNGEISQRRVSLYGSVGWGPLLVADKTIPNFLFSGGGFSIDFFSSRVSYGFVYGSNTTNAATQSLVGWNVSVDGNQVPFFFSYLSGDGFDYILLAGIKVYLIDLAPVKSIRHPFK